MAFTEQQCQALKAKLRYRHVKTRASQGATIAYVEGWHVIAEANRIFGYDAWDRTTLSPRCLWSEMQRGQLLCCYSTKVRITVRAGGTVTVREGIGTGIGRSSFPEVAHEMGLKAAETDATKRALATFGNPFGLALYDKDLSHVTRRTKQALSAAAPAPEETEQPELVLRAETGRDERFEDPNAFVAATLKAIARLRTIDAVYAFWEQNLAAFRVLRRTTGGRDPDPVATIIATLKGKARALGWPPAEITQSDKATEVPDTNATQRAVGACLSRKTSGCAIRRISPSSPANPVSFADAVPRTPIICALPNRAPWGSKSQMSSPCHSATAITTNCTEPATNAPGGRGTASSSRSSMRRGCGRHLDCGGIVQRRTQNEARSTLWSQHSPMRTIRLARSLKE